MEQESPKRRRGSNQPAELAATGGVASEPLPDSGNLTLNRALEYAARGWAVFPLAPGTKKPFKASHGFKDATTDAVIIRRWWAETPKADIGVATGARSGVFVIDADIYKDPHALDDLQQHIGELPETFTVKTPRGGRHLYFQMPPGRSIRNSEGRLAEVIDVRGDGGYVVAPPSTFEGQPYQVLKAAPPAQAPEWLVDRVAVPLHREKEIQGDRETDGGSISPSLVLSVQSAVELALPPGGHLNHTHLFKLARGCIGMSNADKEAAFDEWFSVVQERGLLREGTVREDYAIEFWAAVSKAKQPIGGNDPATRAWALAGEQPFPPEAAAFETPGLKRTLGACYQLERLSKGGEWYLSCHTLARLAVVSPTTAATWLSALIGKGVLRVVRKQTSSEARRFRYVGQPAPVSERLDTKR